MTLSTPEASARKIFGARAAQYTTSAAHTDPKVLARVVELAAPQPDWLALDLATGTGHTAFALAPHVRRVVGTDLTPEMLAEARNLQTQQNIANVEFGLADAHALPFANASLHLITCRRAAHHFSNIALALQEMRRVLRPGGRLVIDDRSVPEDDFVDECMNDLDRCHDESHVRQYRPSQWQHMLQALGFSILTLVPYTKHRPLTSLTHGVSPENVRKIQAVLDRLNSNQRTTLNLVEAHGAPYINHWYIMLAAFKE